MAVVVEQLTFDRHLRHAFAPLSGRLEEGIKSLDGVIEILRLRIEAEAKFASSLSSIINHHGVNVMNTSMKIETLFKDGIDAILSDIRNDCHQRKEFLNSLNEDVYQPIIQMRELYASKNRLFANNTKHNIKELRSQQNQYYKIKTKYDKVCKDASNARTSLLNAKLDQNISSQSILKLGSKVNSTLKIQQSWKEKYDRQLLVWNKHQIKFDDTMTNILQGMQSNECLRMKTVKDSLNKWAVFVTNLSANRNYDVKSLAQSMSLINVDNDLQLFLQNILIKYPQNGPTQPHHSFNYGKSQQIAINNLSKISKNKSSIKSDSQSSLHHRGQSLSSSYTASSIHNRKTSTSYSLSEQQMIQTQMMEMYSINNNHNQSMSNNINKPNHKSQRSISSFIKKKFNKQKSAPPQNRSSIHEQREDSNTRENTLSSMNYNGDVCTPDDEQDIDTPTSASAHTLKNKFKPSSMQTRSHPYSPDEIDPEIPTSNTSIRNSHSLTIDLNNNSSTRMVQQNDNNNNKLTPLSPLTPIKTRHHRPTTPLPKPPNHNAQKSIQRRGINKTTNQSNPTIKSAESDEVKNNISSKSQTKINANSQSQSQSQYGQKQKPKYIIIHKKQAQSKYKSYTINGSSETNSNVSTSANTNTKTESIINTNKATNNNNTTNKSE